MLARRIMTAVALLALLLGVIYSGSFMLFVAVSAAFLAGALWEGFRLFGIRRPEFGAAVWTGVFALLVMQLDGTALLLFSAMCVAIWGIRFAPSLGLGLPPPGSVGSRLLSALYGFAILGCFFAIIALFERSPWYLVSVMAIVWIADIGAYFAGRAFGRRKLAPAISPGKSWEGVLGGWIMVMVLAGVSVAYAPLGDTFAPQVHAKLGWIGFFAVMSLMVAASVIGDLFESQLKRRAGVKDSSGLLPGHGGILDRIDALIPALPLAVLAGYWL
jgi:phosphatidate cytidylyltransferase